MAGGIRAHRLDSLRARREAAGLTVGDLARMASVSDLKIVKAENGDPVTPDITDRLLDALGPAVVLVSSTAANPTRFTTAAHRFIRGDIITIAGHVGSAAPVNGDQSITATSDPNHFTIALDATLGGGTGGTARLSATSLGLVRL
jgi:transcriptional regulator with XRE-family HTH domain